MVVNLENHITVLSGFEVVIAAEGDGIAVNNIESCLVKHPARAFVCQGNCVAAVFGRERKLAQIRVVALYGEFFTALDRGYDVLAIECADSRNGKLITAEQRIWNVTHNILHLRLRQTETERTFRHS